MVDGRPSVRRTSVAGCNSCSCTVGTAVVAVVGPSVGRSVGYFGSIVGCLIA